MSRAPLRSVVLVPFLVVTSLRAFCGLRLWPRVPVPVRQAVSLSAFSKEELLSAAPEERLKSIYGLDEGGFESVANEITLAFYSGKKIPLWLTQSVWAAAKDADISATGAFIWKCVFESLHAPTYPLESPQELLF